MAARLLQANCSAMVLIMGYASAVLIPHLPHACLKNNSCHKC